ncbi:homoserine dehydrogenase [Acidipila sp. EB88]|uniref:homoserine dehydrogenase n=1 Tax=Acidipila sp. EB88 TaxID=2305226 RepID=UPI001F20F1BC|nr:homoserine dehydrogenase [Acidipila sp. EB88]
MQGAAKKVVKVAILGFGTVGSSVARILLDGPAAGELELTHVYNRNVERKRASWVRDTVRWTDSVDEVLASDADVVVELVGGLDPAGDWVRRALAAGKSVVTANKKLIAAHGIELHALARSKDARLSFGAAVAGGIPVIPGLQQGLAGERILRIEGILNGTCNYILSGMEAGADYSTMLGEAQARGYAEADPTEDVGGFDARAKLVILSRLALRADVPVEAVRCRAITRLTSVDFDYARELGCTVRQVSRAELAPDGSVIAMVGPMLVPLRSPLAWSRGTENMVLVGGAFGGDVVFSGHGAGGHPTAVAVVSDLLAIAHGAGAVDLPSHKAHVSSDLHLRHAVRFVVKDRPGIVAGIASALAREAINIDALLQKPGHSKAAMPFVITVEPCASSSLRRALAEVEQMDCLLEPPLEMEILEQ